MEILESRTDALQSLANVRKVGVSPSEYFDEISRLNQELHAERNKTSQLESDLASLNKRFSDFEQKPPCNLPLIDEPSVILINTNKDCTPETSSSPKQLISVPAGNKSNHSSEITSLKQQSSPTLEANKSGTSKTNKWSSEEINQIHSNNLLKASCNVSSAHVLFVILRK